MSLLGVDVGTSALKAAAFRAVDGTPLANARRAYAAKYPAPGRMELDPELVWGAFVEAVREVTADPQVNHDPVTALALSVSCDEVVPVDHTGAVLAPCIMAPDTRGADLLDVVAALLPASDIYARTGIPLAPIHPLVRICWYQRHEPAIAHSAARWLGWGELLLTRLGLPPVSDETTVGRWLAFDVVDRAWMPSVLEAMGISSAIPSVVAPGTWIAVLGAGGELVGLGPNVVVVAGAFDQICTAIGSGLNEPGDVVVGSGTWENTTVVMADPLGDEARDRGVTWGRYLGDRFAALIMNAGGGSIVQWFREQLGQPEDDARPESGARGTDGTPAQRSDRPTSLLFLPHVAGSLAPWRDPASKGAFVGLTLGTTHDELFRAVLEGITFELRLNLEPLPDGPSLRPPIRNTGGGSRSRRWVQMKADVLGMPVATMDTEEPGCLGAAILAGVGSGMLADVESAQRDWCRSAHVVEPDPAAQELYDERFILYRELYPSIRRISAAL